MTLLEKAMANHKPNIGHKPPTEEEKELTLAYLRGEIDMKDITAARGRKATPYTFIARCCKTLFDEGKLVIK